MRLVCSAKVYGGFWVISMILFAVFRKKAYLCTTIEKKIEQINKGIKNETTKQTIRS